jgi:pimeloyl-ACP methyl ester carboxylesterase
MTGLNGECAVVTRFVAINSELLGIRGHFDTVEGQELEFPRAYFILHNQVIESASSASAGPDFPLVTLELVSIGQPNIVVLHGFPGGSDRWEWDVGCGGQREELCDSTTIVQPSSPILFAPSLRCCLLRDFASLSC